LVPLIAMGVPAAMIREYHDSSNYSEDAWKRYFSSNFYFLAGISIFVSVVLYILGSLFWGSKIRSNIPFEPYAQIVLIGLPLGILIQVIQANLRARQEHGRTVAIDLGRNFGMIAIGLTLVVGFGYGVFGFMLSSLIALICVFAIVLLRAWKELLVVRFSWNDVRVSLRYGLPLVPHVLANVIFSVSDRIMLERMSGLEHVGVYNLAFQFSILLTFLIMSTNQAWSPRFYQVMNTRNDQQIEYELKRYACYWFSAFSIAASVLILFGGTVVEILTPTSYHKAGEIIPILAWSGLLQGIYFFGVNSLFYEKKTLLIPILTGMTAGCNIMLNFWLIPHYGALGAAVATIMTWLIVAILANIVGYRYCRIGYPFFQILSILVVLIVITTMALICNMGLLSDILIKILAMSMLFIMIFRLLKSQGYLTFLERKFL